MHHMLKQYLDNRDIKKIFKYLSYSKYFCNVKYFRGRNIQEDQWRGSDYAGYDEQKEA